MSAHDELIKANRVNPVFIKLENLHVLLICEENISAENIQSVQSYTHAASVTLLQPVINDNLRSIASQHPNIRLKQKTYSPADLNGADVVIVIANDSQLSSTVSRDAKEYGTLFYSAGHNGLPNLLSEKQNASSLDEETANTKNGFQKHTGYTDINDKEGEKRWKKIASRFVFAFFFMILGHWLLSYIPFNTFWQSVVREVKQLDQQFLWMIATGFFAQLVDGALGMGYGVTCTTVLLSFGINLSAISGSIHTAEMFSSGASGYSHYRFGNVNKKLFKVLLVPGIIGAVAGALLLSKYGDKYANYVRPLLATYTLILGFRIIVVALRKKKKPGKVKNAGWLAGAGGFLDSFGGGGWGPLVTSTLIAKGRTPRFVIGTVSITEFFVTFATALTFFSQIGISHWQVIVGLIIGGSVAAPIAAKLSGKLPVKTAFIAVGAMVIFWSVRIIIKAIPALF